jgi:RNA polymerase sigma-70 factor (ECF subfamily)
MQGSAAQQAVTAAAATQVALVRDCIESQGIALLGTIRVYVRRTGLADGLAVGEVALEILDQTVVEALEHADRYDPRRNGAAWLLGIAINVIKARRTKTARRARVAPTGTLDDLNGPSAADEEAFDQFLAPERAEEIERWLAPLSTDDQHVIRLAIIEDLDFGSVARRLNVKPGAARVRLHRALNRLRAANNAKAEGERHE